MLPSHVSPSASIQKRLKKEKKAKRKLQEALEFESKRRERVEDALKHSSSSSPSPEPLHAANNSSKNGMTRCLLLLVFFCLPFCLISLYLGKIFFYCSQTFPCLTFHLTSFSPYNNCCPCAVVHCQKLVISCSSRCAVNLSV